MHPIRAVDIDNGIIEGIAIPFDGPWNGKDAFGTVFTRDTNYYEDWFPAGTRPILYSHGQNRYFGGKAIGTEAEAEIQDDGLWVKAELEKSEDYWQRIVPLLDKKALYFSSGAAPALVRSKDGVMTDWARIETSVTPQPANPYAVLSPTRQLDMLRCMDEGVYKYISAHVNLDGIDVSTDIGTSAMAGMLIEKLAQMIYEKLDAGDITPPSEDDGMRSADPILDEWLVTAMGETSRIYKEALQCPPKHRKYAVS